MPKLLVIAGEFPKPSETFVVGHIKGMLARGWDVAVAAYTVNDSELRRLFGGNALKTFELEPAAETIRTRGTLGRWWRLRKTLGPGHESLFGEGAGKKQRARAAALVDVLRDFKPDVMHAHFGPLGLMASPGARLLNIPLIVNFRGYDFLNYPGSAGWSVYDALAPNAIAVGHTKFCEDILRKYLKVPVQHVRRGVDRERFKPPRRRDDWGDTVRMLVVGRLMFSKGHHLAVESLAVLGGLKPDVRFELTLAGGGEFGDALTAIADVLGVRDRVTLAGSLTHDAVGEEMRKADVLLIPSLPRSDGWVENFCTVASEGIASGLAVVASNHGGIPEAVEGAGVLVPGGSAYELARGVAYAMDTRSPAKWSEHALSRAQDYQDSWMMDDYERVTRRAMEATHE